MQSTVGTGCMPAFTSAPEFTSSQTTTSKGQKTRHRASIACSACRDRRIRCVVHPGETECLNCKRTGSDCIIRNDDERRKPISRAYVASLTDRIALLEELLRRKGEEPPPAIHPPRIRPGLPGSEDVSPGRRRSEVSESTLIDNPDDSCSESEDGDEQPPQSSANARSGSAARLLGVSEVDQSLVGQIISVRGHLGIDQTSGSVRFFCSLMNCQLPSDKNLAPNGNSQTAEHSRRAIKTIRMLSQETHDYLLDLYWEHFNTVIPVVHQKSFYDDHEHGGTQFYSPFLHVCVLAVGFRYSDKSRTDIQRIAVTPRESTFHLEAKYMLDVELERAGGIPQVQALLLLANCECAMGRDHTGWLYSGMGVRLAFDIGLHLDTRSSGLSEREVEVRNMTMWACVIFDKQWSLFLGRPTAIKNSDLEMYTLAKRFDLLGTTPLAGSETSLETQTYEALIELMELAGRAAENRERTVANCDRNAYRKSAALDRQLNNWYARLPEALKWEPANIQTAPRSFFVLHQQYHSVHIQILRPFARYEETIDQDTNDLSADGIAASSRKACTSHAIAVIENLWHYRQRFSAKQIFCAAIQTAGTAITALVAELASLKGPKERNHIVRYLKCVTISLHEMSVIFAPAERMCLVLQHVLAEIAQKQRDGSVVPALRQNTEESPTQNAPKRRQLMDPRRTSMLISDGPNTMMQVKGSNDGSALFTPQSDLGGWPFPSPNGQMGSSHPPSLAPNMYGAQISPQAWMDATSQATDAARLGFSGFSGYPESSNDTNQLDFLHLGD